MEAGSRVAQKTMLRFTWQLMAGEVIQSYEVHLLCRHAAMRGVHTPKEWKNELSLGLGAETLDNLTVKAIQRACDEFGLSELAMKLDCRLRFTHARAWLCRYVHVHVFRAHGRYIGVGGSSSISRPNLICRWAIALEDEIHESEVCVRADNASERGVPLPAAWQNALRCWDLSSRAEEAGRALEAVDGVSELSCSLIGVPMQCCAPSGDEPCPGTILTLRAPSSSRKNFALVAKIDGNRWFCHAGSFEVSEAGAPARGCLDETSLVAKDIVADICGEERPAKRIKRHARTFELRELIDASPNAWSTLVALATIKAEHKRAELHGLDPDWPLALACFEKSPWRWEVAEGRASQLRVYFLWQWYDASMVGYAYEVTTQRLDNLLARGVVPSPDGLHLRDRAMWTGLESHAQDQYRRTGCPCIYLGALVNGRYQPDPSLWGCAASQSKQDTMVFFQWQHVTEGRQKKPVIKLSLI